MQPHSAVKTGFGTAKQIFTSPHLQERDMLRARGKLEPQRGAATPLRRWKSAVTDARSAHGLPSKGKSAGENVSYQHDESDFQNQELLFDGGVTRA
jgi:hypothetical protein